MRRALVHAWHVMLRRGPSQFQFWLLALIVGIGAGFAALAFRKGIDWLQVLLYGVDDPRRLNTFAEALPWYWILVIPIMGGLAVGIILNRFTPDGKVRAVSDVIADAALNNGRVERRAGLASAAASLITLGTGGSSGREGPVVHLAGVVSTWISIRINASGVNGRDLLGCAVAAAVSASFNAPIAGALFAMEVVLRRFSVNGFAPIAIASVAGTVINRLEFGDITEFNLPSASPQEFYLELPAFLMLGLICAVVAALLIRTIFFAEDLGDVLYQRLHIPGWLRPAIAGGMLGGIAIWFPHIIGVGYETTAAALNGNLVLHEAIVFTVLKVLAVAVTLGGRMGGGIFSPSLMIGALTGLAFGLIATQMLPEISGSHTIYALVGMGAVSAAVLGAPISTTLIVFELTGDWHTGLAVMVAVSTSTALGTRLVNRSFFLTQLKRRGVHLAEGPQAYLLSMTLVAGLMRPADDDGAPSEEVCRRMIRNGLHIGVDDTLETAMPAFEAHEVTYLPVVGAANGDAPDYVGVLYYVDALKAFNLALASLSREVHG
ncbi:MAG: chloride channel protein [Rhodobacterales bacterium]|nr:chloride channel protein [Rhodobacterales bacterium]